MPNSLCLLKMPLTAELCIHFNCSPIKQEMDLLELWEELQKNLFSGQLSWQTQYIFQLVLTIPMTERLEGSSTVGNCARVPAANINRVNEFYRGFSQVLIFRTFCVLLLGAFQKRIFSNFWKLKNIGKPYWISEINRLINRGGKVSYGALFVRCSWVFRFL